jgi:hypothetical protein
MSAMRGRLVGMAVVGFMLVCCHKVPYEDLMNAPEQVEIESKTITAEGPVWRSYMPVEYEVTGSDLCAALSLVSSDTIHPFPSDVWAARLWVIKSSCEIWGVILRHSEKWWPKYVLFYRVTGGPRWPVGTHVSVAARIRNAEGSTWLIRAPETEVGRVE